MPSKGAGRISPLCSFLDSDPLRDVSLSNGILGQLANPTVLEEQFRNNADQVALECVKQLQEINAIYADNIPAALHRDMARLKSRAWDNLVQQRRDKGILLQYYQKRAIELWNLQLIQTPQLVQLQQQINEIIQVVGIALQKQQQLAEDDKLIKDPQNKWYYQAHNEESQYTHFLLINHQRINTLADQILFKCRKLLNEVALNSVSEALNQGTIITADAVQNLESINQNSSRGGSNVRQRGLSSPLFYRLFTNFQKIWIDKIAGIAGRAAEMLIGGLYPYVVVVPKDSVPSAGFLPGRGAQHLFSREIQESLRKAENERKIKESAEKDNESKQGLVITSKDEKNQQLLPLSEETTNAYSMHRNKTDYLEKEFTRVSQDNEILREIGNRAGKLGLICTDVAQVEQTEGLTEEGKQEISRKLQIIIDDCKKFKIQIDQQTKVQIKFTQEIIRSYKPEQVPPSLEWSSQEEQNKFMDSMLRVINGLLTLHPPSVKAAIRKAAEDSGAGVNTRQIDESLVQQNIRDKARINKKLNSIRKSEANQGPNLLSDDLEQERENQDRNDAIKIQNDSLIHKTIPFKREPEVAIVAWPSLIKDLPFSSPSINSNTETQQQSSSQNTKPTSALSITQKTQTSQQNQSQSQNRQENIDISILNGLRLILNPQQYFDFLGAESLVNTIIEIRKFWVEQVSTNDNNNQSNLLALAELNQLDKELIQEYEKNNLLSLRVSLPPQQTQDKAFVQNSINQLLLHIGSVLSNILNSAINNFIQQQVEKMKVQRKISNNNGEPGSNEMNPSQNTNAPYSDQQVYDTRIIEGFSLLVVKFVIYSQQVNQWSKEMNTTVLLNVFRLSLDSLRNVDNFYFQIINQHKQQGLLYEPLPFYRILAGLTKKMLELIPMNPAVIPQTPVGTSTYFENVSAISTQAAAQDERTKLITYFSDTLLKYFSPDHR
ncbi:MAG: hypothetical protein EZS28_025055, partial [Streblomastix strix]